jgi:C1q domain
MAIKVSKRYYLLLMLLLAGPASFGQNVPLGIFYQAVARDNFGKELANRSIDVKFSIISGNPLGTVVYQELHSGITTSKYGVFSLIIGHGTPTGGLYGELSQVQWNTAYHYLKIEVKFDNDFVDMGTMQFLAVPYALYAQKSLEPGPQGPKGDPGDPASDNQTLSFDGNNLSIANGNTVNLSTLNVPHQLTLLGDTLSILGGNKVGLTNQIQDLQLDVNNKLKITKNAAATVIDLSKFTQTLSYNSDNYQLSLSNGGGTASLGQIVAYRAGIASTVNLPNNTPVILVFNQLTGVYYSDGIYFNSSSGSFTAPSNGIYSFSVFINLPIGGSVIINLFGDPYETIIGPTNVVGNYRGTITMKLNKGDVVNASVLQNNGYPIPFNFSGSFSGYKVY